MPINFDVCGWAQRKSDSYVLLVCSLDAGET